MLIGTCPCAAHDLVPCACCIVKIESSDFYLTLKQPSKALELLQYLNLKVGLRIAFIDLYRLPE